ncbi:MAG: DUF4340 domain-containing protein [Clostridia bacterium]|nr:DUF4340 domain-containing protein [Clostridia bacterium]
MSDFFENEENVIPEHEPKKLVVPEHDDFDDEFGSVFGDPTELVRKKATNGGKKRILISVVSCLLAAVLVGGSCAVEALVKPRKTETPKFSEPQNMMTRSADDFTKVTVQNENGTFDFVGLKQTEEVTDDTTGETSTQEVIVWSMSGKYSEQADNDKIAEIVSALTNIQYTETVEPDEQYGLDKPRCTVTVTDPVGGDFTLKIGAEAFTSCYVSYSADGKIYKAVAEDTEALFFKLVDVLKADDVPGIQGMYDLTPYLDADGSSFKNLKMTVSGKNFPQPIVIVETGEADAAYPYKMTSPEERFVDSDKADEVAEALLSGVSVDGLLALEATDASIKEFGLDDPDVVLSITVGDKTHTVKIAKYGDYEAAILSDDQNIIRKSSSVSAFFDYTVESYYAK